MDADFAEQARKILAKCETLSEADDWLATLTNSRAMRWGLWDGFAGRARVTSGLANREHADYREGCELGCRLATSELPS